MHLRPNSSIKTGGVTGLYNLDIGINSTKFPNVSSNLNTMKNFKNGKQNNTPSLGTGSSSNNYYSRDLEVKNPSYKNMEFESKLTRPLSIQGSRTPNSNAQDENRYFDNNVNSNRYYLQPNYVGNKESRENPGQNQSINIKSVNVLSNSYAMEKPALRGSDNSYKEKLQTSSFKQTFSPAYLNNYSNSNSQGSSYQDFSSKNKSNNYLIGVKKN